MRSNSLLSCLLIIAGWAVVFDSRAQPAAEYREALLELNGLAEQLHSTVGLNRDTAYIDKAMELIIEMPDEQVLQLHNNGMPLATLESMLATAQAKLSQFQSMTANQPIISVFNSASESETGTIDIPVPETAIGFCIDVPGVAVGIAQATYKTLSAVLEAAKFTCLQQVATESVSLACTVLEIAAVTAEFAYREGDFCRDETRASKGEAVLQLDRNIGAFFNQAIDQNTISSRATQDSVDQVIMDTMTASDEVTDIQGDVDSNFITIGIDLDMALADLNSLSEGLTELIAEAGDIQFRTQVNQVNIEDIQARTADLQESGDEIHQDTQSLIAATSALQVSAGELSDAIADGFNQVNRDEIARALANPNHAVPDYIAPATEGGQLEQAREVLIEAIALIDSISPGNTGMAQMLLIQGDQAYNNQDYLSAYSLFAQAYQALQPANSLR